MPTEGEKAETIPSIRTARLELVSVPRAFMEALLASDIDAASEWTGASVPDNLRDHLEDFLRYRLAQVIADRGFGFRADGRAMDEINGLELAFETDRPNPRATEALA